jgi:hypothetical protein
MIEIGPQHPMDYREEIARPLFERIRQVDSFAIIGGGSMGKTRLLDFVSRAEVQQHYLQDLAPKVLLLRTDCNRAVKTTEWGLYELLLTSIIEGCGQTHETRARRVEINNLREPVIIYADNALLALRQLELAISILTQDLGLRVCLLLDEFDEMFKSLEAPALANLRGMRDANKNQLCYGLFFRHISEKVRDVSDCESFYELFSHRQMGLKPYSLKDALRMLVQLEERRKRKLLPQTKDEIYRLSGGHPGLMGVLFDLSEAGEAQLTDERHRQTLLDDLRVQEECSKLWRSLHKNEQAEILKNFPRLIFTPETRRWLMFKGLLINDNGYEDLFSPLFRMYVEQAEHNKAPTG